MSDDELSKLQEAERGALVGDRTDVVTVVDGLRKYRAIVRGLIDRRYRDGFVELGGVAEEVDELENGSEVDS